MRRLLLLSAALAMAFASSCAAPASETPSVAAMPADDGCIDADTLTTQAIGNGSAVIVRAGVRLDYQVELGGANCNERTWAMLWPSTASSSQRICTSHVFSSMSDAIVTNGQPAQCIVRNIRRIAS